MSQPHSSLLPDLSRFDATGALRSMWTPSVEQAFAERASCVADQYAQIEAAPGIHIDGQLTLGENIADLGGLKLAYLALNPTMAKSRCEVW